MIRIADIISGSPDEDKSKQEKKKQEENKETTPPSNVELAKDQAQVPSPEKQQEEQEKPPLIELSKSMLDKVKLEGAEESCALYSNLISSLKDMAKDLVSGQGISLDTISDSLNALIGQIALGNQELLVLTQRPYPDEYLYTHMVNVSVLCVVLGRQAGFNKSRLLELSLGAVLHDIGLVKSEEIIYAARKITKEEYEQIKQHPILGVKLLEGRKGVSKQTLSIILQHHERLDGSGYPKGLKAQDIEDNAQIVALVNAYESLTHKRPFRDRILNSKAIRLMVERQKIYNSEFLKLFIEVISIYPLNCWVRLSSDEIAKVVGVNKSYLLKPKVEILFDKYSKKLDSPKIIDLSKQLNIYVKEEIFPEAVESKLRD